MSDTIDDGKTASDGPVGDSRGPDILAQVNRALADYSDKDWNYSRISLVMKDFDSVDGPYVLGIEMLNQRIKAGRDELKTLSDEVKWGDRHSSELGMLEVVSLRLNKALLESTSDEYWKMARPVVRIAKKQDIDREKNANAIWYQISEVAGEDFDNR